MENKIPKRVAFVGVGEIILEYAYPALSKLESEGDITIVKVADKCDLNGTLSNLKSRHEKYEKERDSINDIVKRLNKEGKPLGHYQTEGDRFDPEIESQFFNGIDILYLATPNNVRVGLVEQAAQAGKGIIIEKPLAHTKGTINDIVKVILENNIKAICAEHYSYKDPSLEFFETFESYTKNYGKILSIEGFLQEDDFLGAERYIWLLDPSISGGGIWLDTGVHMMHLLYATGARMRDVQKATSYNYQFPTGDSRNDIVQSETAADVYLNLEGSNGRVHQNAVGHIRVAKCVPESLKYFKVCFEKGEMFLDFMKNSISYLNRTATPSTFSEEDITTKTNPYRNMMLKFIDYLETGVKLPTDILSVKESTDAIFNVYDRMQKGDPRQFY